MRITHPFVDMLIATYPQSLLHINGSAKEFTFDFNLDEVGLLVLVTCLALIKAVLEWKEDDDEFGKAVLFGVISGCFSFLLVRHISSWWWVAAVALLYLVVVAVSLTFERIRRKRADDTHDAAGASE